MANAVRVAEHLYRCSGGYRADVEKWCKHHRHEYSIYMDANDVDQAMADMQAALLPKDGIAPPKFRAPARLVIQTNATQRVFFIKFMHFEASRHFASTFTDIKFLRPSVSFEPKETDFS